MARGAVAVLLLRVRVVRGQKAVVGLKACTETDTDTARTALIRRRDRIIMIGIHY